MIDAKAFSLTSEERKARLEQWADTKSSSTSMAFNPHDFLELKRVVRMLIAENHLLSTEVAALKLWQSYTEPRMGG